MDYIDPNEICLLSTKTDFPEVAGNYGYALFKSGRIITLDSAEYENVKLAIQAYDSEDYIGDELTECN